MTEKSNTQPNIEAHSKSQFEAMIQQAMNEGGLQLTAMKGFGKTRLLFSMAQSIRNFSNSKVYIFDGSLAWLYGFSKIPVFNINEEDITATEQKDVLEVEQYRFNNWQLVKMALESNKDLLFRLKTRKPSKRGFAVRTIVNYLDAQQRKEIEQSANHQPQNNLAFFIEEFQDCFNNRSTLRNDCEEFLTVFNESRNQHESFWTCSQRETDCSKTLRTKQLMAYGKIPEYDKSAYHRRLEKEYNVNFSKLAQRNWVFEGQTIVSPDWIQQGKPFIINRALRAKFNQQTQKPQQPQGLIQRFQNWQNKRHNKAMNKYQLRRVTNIDEQSENDDPSVYDYEDPEATQEDDMEEDLALLDESDMGW